MGGGSLQEAVITYSNIMNYSVLIQLAIGTYDGLEPVIIAELRTDWEDITRVDYRTLCMLNITSVIDKCGMVVDYTSLVANVGSRRRLAYCLHQGESMCVHINRV